MSVESGPGQPIHSHERGVEMATKLEQEAYLYRRAIDIIDSPDTDSVKEELLFEEVWIPLAALYKDRIEAAKPDS
jgi:hypothetical protein